MEQVATNIRRFIVKFDNHRRHGKYPKQTFEAEGVEFNLNSHRVVIDTDAVMRITFNSIGDMQEYLEGYGHIEVTWID